MDALRRDVISVTRPEPDPRGDEPVPNDASHRMSPVSSPASLSPGKSLRRAMSASTPLLGYKQTSRIQNTRPPKENGIVASMAAAAALLGRRVEAQAGLEGFVRLLPRLSLGDPRLIRPFRRPTDRERFLAGLRKAGLAE